MAVLGSDRAREHLINVYHQDSFPGYLERLDSMRMAFDAFTAGDWNRNIYNGWLHVLKLNLEPVVRPHRRSLVAKFTQSPVYADKTLMTTCSSWTELRHDTILYAKQSYTTVGTKRLPEEPPPDRAYVEPKPAVFRRLAGLAAELRRLAAAVEEADKKLDALVATASKLADIADSELKGQEMSRQDAEFCKHIHSKIASMTKFSVGFRKKYLAEPKPVPPQTEPKLKPESDQLEEIWTYAEKLDLGCSEPEDMVLVADVHTHPTTGSVLEEAVGNPVRLYAVIPFYGKQYLAIGACYSYYEFTKPMSQRMTDEEWRALDPKPPMPVWTQSFITR
ncbi:MAG: DUF3160 domain-containing protein, partial [candidate division WOR-3 bacterium]